MKNRILSAVGSLLVAAGLWAYVVSTVSTTTEVTFSNIPVALEGEGSLDERGLMLTGGQDSTVSLRLSGTRADINKLSSSNITVTVDLTKIYDEGPHALYYTIHYPGDIQGSAVSVVHQSPTQIRLEVERKVTKKVPVQLFFTGGTGEDYIADTEDAVIDYPEVTITGPESVISRIGYAAVEVDLTGRTESVSESFRYTLCNADTGEPVDAAMVTTDVEEVRVDVKIQRQKELKLTVTIVPGGGATEQTAQVTISPETIRVSGSDTALNNLGDELNIATINLADYATGFTTLPDIVLPEGITNVSNLTKASVRVAFPDLTTRDFTVTTFRPVNVPEGMEAEILTAQLVVTIRGPKEQMNSLRQADLVIQVDFANAEVGTTTYKAQVTLPESFADCGAAGTIGTVTATIRPAEDTNTPNRLN